MQQLILGTGTAIWWLTEPHSSHIIDHPSSLPDPLLELVCGLGHLDGVEHQVDIVSSRDP